MLGKWRGRRRAALRTNPELKRLARAVLVAQIGTLALSILLGLLWMALAIALAVLLETLIIRLFDARMQLRESIRLLEHDREQTEAAFRDIRAQRHDFLAHAGAIQYMLEESRFEEARSYMSRLVGEYERMNTGLRGEKAHMAALLLRTMQRADAAGVRMRVELAQPLSELPLPQTDQSKLVANVLNNALEAAETSGAAEPFVKVTSLIGGGLYVLQVDNSTAPLCADTTNRLYRSYGFSTKEGEHRGTGTYIIAAIVDSRRGHLDFSAVKDRFSLKIKLPIVK